MKPYKFSPDTAPALRAGVMINPSSGGGNDAGLRLRSALGDCGIPFFVLENFSDLHGILSDFSARGINVLVLSSGDGTIQAVQTLLSTCNIFDPLPYLVLLPHGSTNMTARRLGLRGKFSGRNLPSFLSSLDDTGSRFLIDCPTLRIMHAEDGIERYGMFLGCGIVTRGVEYCQSRLHDMGLRGEWANLFAFMRMVVAFSVRRLRGGGGGDRDGSVDLRIFSGDREVGLGDHFCISATTLDRLVLGLRPWHGGIRDGEDFSACGAIRMTVIGFPPPFLLRWLVPFLYGGSRRFSRVPSGCSGFRSDLVRIETSHRVKFILDGEFFFSSPGVALEVGEGSMFRYIVS